MFQEDGRWTNSKQPVVCGGSAAVDEVGGGCYRLNGDSIERRGAMVKVTAVAAVEVVMCGSGVWGWEDREY